MELLSHFNWLFLIEDFIAAQVNFESIFIFIHVSLFMIHTGFFSGLSPGNEVAWICVPGKLGHRSHMIIMTSSFSSRPQTP